MKEQEVFIMLHDHKDGPRKQAADVVSECLKRPGRSCVASMNHASSQLNWSGPSIKTLAE